MRIVLLLACLWLIPFSTAQAQTAERGIADFPKLNSERDWPWWRGPTRNGIAVQNQTPPTQWSATENILWQTPVPGRGHASPIVVDRQVFLATADEGQQLHQLVAFDRATGKQNWLVELSSGGFPARNHAKNTEATSTIACDGERLFASYYNHDTMTAHAVDLTGKVLWKKTVGPFRPKRYEYGFAPSPLIYRNTVIIATEYDGDSAITALDRATGEQVWRTKRPSSISFSSPVVCHVAGRDQLLISGIEMIASYDPATGKELWTTPGTTAATCGTMIWEGDIVFASGGYPKAETLAVKVGKQPEVIWKNRQKCYEQSMIVHQGFVYGLTDSGVLYCWQATDGKEMWSQRLRGPISSSPVLAGGNIYWANEQGTMYVFKPNPNKFELVAENKLDDEGFASPAIVGSQIFWRTAKMVNGKRQELLYCIGK